MACLDTTILIDAAGRGGRPLRARAREKLASLVDMDVLIAAVALVHGERIVTRNTRHFEAIPGLAVESY
jgi:predicted nucleic acid-binding protein